MKNGFILIELLVVVLIIGVLAAVALPQYTKTVERARVAEAETVLKTLKEQLEFNVLEHGGCNYDESGFDGFAIRVPGLVFDGGDVCNERYCAKTKNWQYELDGCEASAYPLYGNQPGLDSDWSLWASPRGVYTDEREGKIYCQGDEEACKARGFTRKTGFIYVKP